jgi:hypothetical protein
MAENPSSIVINLSQDDLDQLQMLASRQGIDVPSLARRIIKTRLEVEAWAESDESQGERNGICVIDMNSLQISPEAFRNLLKNLKGSIRIRTLAPADMGYEEVEKLIEESI